MSHEFLVELTQWRLEPVLPSVDVSAPPWHGTRMYETTAIDPYLETE